MPLLPTITIHTEDIEKIRQALIEKNPGPAEVQITDQGDEYTIRDSGGFLISNVPKKPNNESSEP